MIKVMERRRRVNIVYAPEFIPVCVTHDRDMIPYSRRTSIVYFCCPVTGCHCTDKVVRKAFTASGKIPTDAD